MFRLMQATQAVEQPSPVQLAIREWQRQLIEKQR
jgi:hypothetical protein